MNDTKFVNDAEICSFIEGIKKLEVEKSYNQFLPNVFKILKFSFGSIQKLGRPMLIEKEKEIEQILKFKKIVNFCIQNDQKIQCFAVLINKQIKHISYLGNKLA